LLCQLKTAEMLPCPRLHCNGGQPFQNFPLEQQTATCVLARRPQNTLTFHLRISSQFLLLLSLPVPPPPPVTPPEPPRSGGATVGSVTSSSQHKFRTKHMPVEAYALAYALCATRGDCDRASVAQLLYRYRPVVTSQRQT
jgi:hypothetical protein